MTWPNGWFWAPEIFWWAPGHLSYLSGLYILREMELDHAVRLAHVSGGAQLQGNLDPGGRVGRCPTGPRNILPESPSHWSLTKLGAPAPFDTKKPAPPEMAPAGPQLSPNSPWEADVGPDVCPPPDLGGPELRPCAFQGPPNI